jgi:GT2 family glycosyltransferase
MSTVAVVLHYENSELTQKCIDSIKKTSPEVQILVVDNNSPSQYTFSNEGIAVIKNYDRNAVSGMNCGFLWALNEMKADYIVNFDNDIVCLPGWHEPLVKAMESDHTIGVVGGKQWTPDMKYYRCVGLDLVGGNLCGNWPKEQQEVTWIQGSFVMMRAEMMRKIGVHDDRFKVLCSDADYCLHAKDRGWKVVFVPESNVIHIGGASYSKVVDSWEQDNVKMLQKWSGISAAKILKGFPLDYNQNKFLDVQFKIREEKKAEELCQK